MASSQLPPELLDKIKGYAIEGEIVKVIQEISPEWVEEVFLDPEDAAEMAEEEIDAFWAVQKPCPSGYKLEKVQLVFSDDLKALLDAEETRDALTELVYKNAAVDLSGIKLYNREDYQKMLKEKLRRFRKVRVGLGMANQSLAELFDHIDHLSLLAGGYQWPMKEDTSATIWARAKKSQFPLTADAVVDVVRADNYPFANEPFRLVSDAERDEKAVTWARSVGGLGRI